MTLRPPQAASFSPSYENSLAFLSGLSWNQTINEDFIRYLGTSVSTTYNFAGLRGGGAGAGAGGLGQTAAVDGHPGIFRLLTGSTALGYATVLTQLETFVFGTNRHRLVAVFRLPTLSDGTQNYTARVGFLDWDLAESTDAIYLRYNSALNGGKFEFVTRSNGVETATDTGISVVANTWYRLTIDVNAAGTSVAWDVNGTSGAVATNIPTGATRSTGAGAGIFKLVGTTSRELELDLIQHWQEFTTPR